MFGTGDAADASAHADIHFVLAAGTFAKGCDQCVVVIFVHGGVEIDNVQPFVASEFVKLSVYVGNSEFAAAAVHELDRLS